LLVALCVFATDRDVRTFGELSGRHPLFILVINTPATAAALLIGFPAQSQDSMTNSW